MLYNIIALLKISIIQDEPIMIMSMGHLYLSSISRLPKKRSLFDILPEETYIVWHIWLFIFCILTYALLLARS